MSTKIQKRETKQVRVGIGNHKILKLRAIEKGTTISQLLDEVIHYYFVVNDKQIDRNRVSKQ